MECWPGGPRLEGPRPQGMTGKDACATLQNVGTLERGLPSEHLRSFGYDYWAGCVIAPWAADDTNAAYLAKTPLL